MKVSGLMDAAAVILQGDQYAAYTTITENIQAPGHRGKCFFVTRPGGTGKSYLLKALQHRCNSSRNTCLLLAPTGIAASNIEANTIHSALLIWKKAGAYNTGIFRFNETKREEIKAITTLILDEISMVEAELLDFVSSVFRRLKSYFLPFGGLTPQTT
jgi:ATP-dependent DNA helicase PIF1